MNTKVNQLKPKSNLTIFEALNQRQFNAKTNFKKNVSNSLFCMKRLQIEDKLRSKPVSAMSFNPTGDVIASVTSDLHLNLWLWKKNNMFYTKRTAHTNVINNAKFLNLGGGYHIVTGGRDGEIRYQHIADNGVILENRLTRYRLYPEAIATDEMQPQVFLSCGDEHVQRHDLRVNLSMNIDQIYEHEREINHMDTNPLNNNEFLICTGDSTIRMFDQRNTRKIVHSFSSFSERKSVPRCAYYNYNGEEILGTYREGICLFNRNTKMNDPSLVMLGSSNITMQNRAKFFGSRSNYVVVGSECGNLFVWDKGCGTIVKCTLGDEVGAMLNVECHPYEPNLCSIGAEENIKIWSPLYEGNGNVSQIIEKNSADLYQFQKNPIGFFMENYGAP